MFLRIFYSFFCLLAVVINNTYSQNLDTSLLNDYFQSLDQREEAMGSIAIAKNGKLIYTRAIGFQYQAGDTLIPANTDTHYRIWSITKTYTATMIFQLIDEGQLTLATSLDQFYPQIPNADKITIQHLLGHRSGIPDFIHKDLSKIEEPITSQTRIDLLSSYTPDFVPDERWDYSNSNYVLLGYIIEKLDQSTYETALFNRIITKIGAKHTYFSENNLNYLSNKAYSYRFYGKWEAVDEGDFSGAFPGPAGGIIATPSDMIKFIEALFTGLLITKRSLDQMLAIEDPYKLGIMETYFDEEIGYGHTGGYIATESSLFYYPADSLTIAFCTNGIVIRKEEILDNVLKIYHSLPFGISKNRWKILGVVLLFLGLFQFLFKDLKTTENQLKIGFGVFILFWASVFVAYMLSGDYDFGREGITKLNKFYMPSATFMATMQFVISFLILFFIKRGYHICQQLKISFLPFLLLALMPISMVVSTLFPFPNSYFSLFANLIILTGLSPLLAILLWRDKKLIKLRILAGFCFILIIVALGLIMSRSVIPAFVHENFGWLQSGLYLGLTLWIGGIAILMSGAKEK